MPTPHIAFLLGKPPQQSSMFPEVFRLLEQRGIAVSVYLPHEATHAIPDWVFAADLAVVRGLGPAALAGARVLERGGLPICNAISALERVADRLRVLRTLERSGLLVPVTREFGSWCDVARQAEQRPILVKMRDGELGRGAGVVGVGPGDVPGTAPFPGPYLVQERVPNDGVDRKLYVAGDQVRGLLKPSPVTRRSASPRVFTPDATLVSMALAAGVALGLHIYGVDIVQGPDGPVVVDVNPFPGFRGVPGAAELVAAALCLLARGPVR